MGTVGLRSSVGGLNFGTQHSVLIFLGLSGESRLGPFFPPAFQGIDLLESQGNQILCHPGTGSFAFSGTVKNKGFVFPIFFCPGFGIFLGIFANRPLDFQVAFLPIPPATDIQNHQIGLAHPGFQLFLGDSRNLASARGSQGVTEGQKAQKNPKSPFYPMIDSLPPILNLFSF